MWDEVAEVAETVLGFTQWPWGERSSECDDDTDVVDDVIRRGDRRTEVCTYGQVDGDAGLEKDGEWGGAFGGDLPPEAISANVDKWKVGEDESSLAVGWRFPEYRCLLTMTLTEDNPSTPSLLSTDVTSKSPTPMPFSEWERSCGALEADNPNCRREFSTVGLSQLGRGTGSYWEYISREEIEIPKKDINLANETVLDTLFRGPVDSSVGDKREIANIATRGIGKKRRGGRGTGAVRSGVPEKRKESETVDRQRMGRARLQPEMDFYRGAQTSATVEERSLPVHHIGMELAAKIPDIVHPSAIRVTTQPDALPVREVQEILPVYVKTQRGQSTSNPPSMPSEHVEQWRPSQPQLSSPSPGILSSSLHNRTTNRNPTINSDTRPDVNQLHLREQVKLLIEGAPHPYSSSLSQRNPFPTRCQEPQRLHRLDLNHGFEPNPNFRMLEGNSVGSIAEALPQRISDIDGAHDRAQNERFHQDYYRIAAHRPPAPPPPLRLTSSLDENSGSTRPPTAPSYYFTSPPTSSTSPGISVEQLRALQRMSFLYLNRPP